MNKIIILKQCTVEGLVVKLPAGQLDRKLYEEVANALNLIGGKWVGRKVMGFVFDEDPTDLLAQIAGGENRNLKKEFQFFATPPELAEYVVRMAEIGPDDMICEPSAGSGSMVNAVQKLFGQTRMVYGYEIMPINQSRLSKISHFELLGPDFLACDKKFDRFIANPPFSNNQDIEHIRKMYDCLQPGGRVVTICSKHYQMASGKKETTFSDWLHELNAYVVDIPAGTFKESGTQIATVLIRIDK